MKKLFIIIIIFINFQSWTKADDIRDFQIEGMSIGDSLLDFMTENEIKDALKSKFSFYYTDKFVTISGWDIKDKFTTYDNVGFVLKLDDESYKIFALEGTFLTQNGNIQDCYKKQNTIASDVKKILKTKYERDTWFLDKNRIKKHQLSVRYIDYISTDNRKPISIVCYDINKDSDEYTRLTVAIDSLEFDQFLDTQ